MSHKKYINICILILIPVFLFPLRITAEELPKLKVKSLVEPVRNTRIWTTALSPNPRGSYNFICQMMNYGKNKDAEWVILDLAANKASAIKLPGYANSGYNYKTQLRAPNGRIFFSVSGGNIYYYEPEDETIKKVKRILKESKPGQRGDVFIYRLKFGPDGYLYGTTQSNNSYTSLVKLNPDTLERKLFPNLGSGKRPTLTYGYYFEVDPPWAYILVGQEKWELVALNMESGEQKVLAVREKGHRISFNNRESVRASMSADMKPGEVDLKGKGYTWKGHTLYTKSGKKTEYYWCVDGELVPAESDYNLEKLPFTPKSKKKFEKIKLKETKPLAMGTSPEVDVDKLKFNSTGKAALPWRRAGSDKKYKYAEFHSDSIEGINIESLIALQDGTLFGNCKQYNGFFRYNPKTKKCSYYGKHGPSGPKYGLIDAKLYFSGYPTASTYCYDPAKPWAITDEDVTSKTNNPYRIGYFGTSSGAHFSYYLLPADNERIYFGGRRERKSTGTGLGWYDLKTEKFFGRKDILKDRKPRGMVLLPKLKRIIVSGELYDKTKSDEAKLVVFDYELKEIERISLGSGFYNSGQLFTGGKDSQFIGIINTDKCKAIYIYDFEKKDFSNWVNLTYLPSQKMSFSGIFKRPVDNTSWMIIDNVLKQLDLQTLRLTPKAEIDKTFRYPCWIGKTLYGASGNPAESSYKTKGSELVILLKSLK
ncbi:MAG: NHL repeat-containing protein [Planctomycetota bacterium]|jgi:hypothetical protein